MLRSFIIVRTWIVRVHSGIRLRRAPAAQGFDMELVHCTIVFMVDGPTLVHSPESRSYTVHTGGPIHSAGGTVAPCIRSRILRLFLSALFGCTLCLVTHLYARTI